MTLGRGFYASGRDLFPIFAVVAFFQLLVLRQPVPDLGSMVAGAVLVVVGLAIFVQGLEVGLFPIGDAMAYALARKGSTTWLFIFAFALGFGASAAEPALIAVVDKAADTAAASGVITPAAQASYALRLRFVICAAVGVALMLGVLRMLLAWPMHWLLMGAYVVIVLLSPFAPDEILAIAYDSGPVSNSVITVPLVAALGVGLASSIEGRNPLVDGFGFVALSTAMPMIAILLFGIFSS